MSRQTYLFMVPVLMLACAIPGRLDSDPRPPTDVAVTADTPVPTPLPATPTALPPTPTPIPPLITADTVGSLTVARSFGEGIVRAIALSPDAAVVAAAEGDAAATIGTIQLYEPASGRSLGKLEGHESAVWGLAFSPDGRYLASASRDHTARIWDWRAGTRIETLHFPNEVVSVAFSPDSRTLAVGGVDEPPGHILENAAIWTYAVDSWEPELKLAEFWNIADIVFTPDGSRIAGGGTSRNVRVWRASDGAEQFILYHAGQVGSLSVSPDGSTLAAALCESSSAGRCVRGAVWLWNLHTGTLMETISDFADAVGEVAYSVDGSLLFVASMGGELRVYPTADYLTPLTANEPDGLLSTKVLDLVLSSDGRFVVTAGTGTIDVWQVGP